MITRFPRRRVEEAAARFRERHGDEGREQYGRFVTSMGFLTVDEKEDFEDEIEHVFEDAYGATSTNPNTPNRMEPVLAAKTSNAATSVPTDDFEDLLSDMGDGSPKDDAATDLLDELTESTGTPWQPAKDDTQPKGIQGKVTDVFEVSSDYSDDPIPGVVITDKDGEEWSVRGYHRILKDEIQKKSPAVGDLMAVKYIGQLEPKKKGQQGAQKYLVKVVRK